MEYIIVSSDSMINLEKRVVDYIKMGYKPQGGMTITRVNSEGFCQPMVKEYGAGK